MITESLYSPVVVTKDFDPSFDSEPISPDQGIEDPPSYVKPLRSVPKKNSLEDDQREINTKRSLFRFGVIIEDDSAEILSEVTRDIIALLTSLPANSQLVVVSPSESDYWSRLTGSLPVLFQRGDFETVKTWKSYWKNEKPPYPEGIRVKFEKRVGNPSVKKITLRPNSTGPTPFNRDANRMLPMGSNPMFRRPPPRAPVQMTPQLYMWSSDILTSD
jgi:hypothetical protein